MTEELLITIPDDVQAFLNGLNAGDVGFEGFPEGRLLHFEGFSDQCWQAHEDRFGVDGAQEGVAIVESEIIADWLGRHPGASLLASGWEGGCEPWDDCIFWAYRSEEHTSELQSLMRISYAVFCLKKQQIDNYKTLEMLIVNTIKYKTV